MSRALRVALPGVLLCLAAGCTAAPPPVAEPQIATITFAATACNEPGGIASRVRAFADAYDAGRPGLADRFIAPAARFRWYSEPGLREGPAAYDRSTLDGYLTRREQAGDRLEVVSVRPSGDGGDFAFTVRRGDEALPSKGALDCRTG